MLKISVCAIGQKMPLWLKQGCVEFEKRLENKFHLKWIELELTKRTHTLQLSQILEKEAQLIETHIPHSSYTILLDSGGKSYSSQQLAKKFTELQLQHSHLCFIIGGPEGLHPNIKQIAAETWSLSTLTFSHPLVRLILLESLFRSWCIIHNHPYHK